MRGIDPGRGEAEYSGPPRASQARDERDHQPGFDDERRRVSLGLSVDQGGPKSLDPEPLSDMRSQPAADVLAAVARMMSSHSVTTGAARKNLLRLLDDLEAVVRARGDKPSLPVRDALMELEGRLKLFSRQRALTPDELAACGDLLRQTRHAVSADEACAAEAALDPNPPIAGAGHATQAGPFDRMARELMRSLERFGAAKSQSPAPTESERESSVTARQAEVSQDLAATAREILDLLKDPARDDSIRALELRLDSLARTAEEAIRKAGRDDQSLSAQIDAGHQFLAARFEAGLAAASSEMGALKDLIQDLPKSAELPHAQPVVPTDELSREIAKLAERLDRVGEGFERLRTTSTLSPEAAFDDAHGLLREIADLRALQDENGRRAQIVLASVQDAMGQIADRLTRLETRLGEMEADPSALAPSSPDAFAPFFAFLAEQRQESGNPHLPAAKGDKGFDEGNQPSAKLQIESRSLGISGDVDAFLIEPGLGYPGPFRDREATEQGAPPKVDRIAHENTSRAELIAAARRAARGAKAGPSDAVASPIPQTEPDPQPHPAFFQLKLSPLRLLQRPLTWGIGVLVMALGAYTIVQTLTHRSELVPSLFNQFHNNIKVNSSMPPPMGQAETQGKMPASQAAGDPETAEPARSSLPGGVYLDPSPLVPPNGSGTAPNAISVATLKSAARIIAGSGAIVTGTIGQSSGAGKAPAQSANAAAFAPIFPLSPLPGPASPSDPGNPAPVATEPPPAKTLMERAEAGDAAAQFDLAVRAAEGKDGPPNYSLAVQWYDKAAQQGFAAAEYRLGSLYERGLGVGKDMQRAKALYRLAAEKGNIRAMHNLGVLAAEGNDGKPDYEAAALWFGKAADFGVRDSQFNLAVLLARGLGVSKDLVKSYTWFAVVAAAGDEDAAKKRDDVAARLTSSELAAANASAAGFRPRPADRTANESAAPEWISEASPPQKPKVSGL
ncbi:hypothetical protein CU048_01120 [Beijerinckiaceae bacterium]|nr:hypothetical protein CU048_01120 [Beijerinckiaceae bacterium]